MSEKVLEKYNYLIAEASLEEETKFKPTQINLTKFLGD